MAITTVNGKMSVMNFILPYMPQTYPTIDDSVDQANKQAFLWGFAEILWQAPAEVPSLVGGPAVYVALFA